MSIDTSEALYHVSHLHPVDVEITEEHKDCTPVLCRRLGEGPQMRYLPVKKDDIRPLFTRDDQFMALTHEHDDTITYDSTHRKCRPVICRKSFSHARMRYIYGAADLQTVSSDGMLRAV